MRICFIILVLFFASCGQKQYENDIKSLDSLQKKVVEVGENFKTLDSLKFANIANEIPLKIDELKKVYMPDSINLDILSLVNAYNGCRNYYASFNVQRLRVGKEIPYTKKQLSVLASDLKNNSLKKEDAKKYIGIEKNAASSLCQLFEDLKSMSTQKAKTYDSLLLEMNQLIDSLRADSLNVQAIRLKLLKSRTKRR